MSRGLGLIFLMTVTFIGPVKADMAPPSGYSKVSVNLIIETKEDVSDYKFYIDFFGDKKDVEIKNNGITNIPPMGGGARYSSGTLWAVPKNNSGQPIELLKHQFSREIPTKERENISSVIYRLEHDGKVLKVVSNHQVIQKSAESGNNLDFTFFGIYKGLTVWGFAVLIGILLMFIVFGIWLFRKKRRKLRSQI